MSKLLTRNEVENLTGLTRTTIYRMMREADFPEPLKIGARAVRWKESEVIAWIESRPRAGGELARAAV